MHGIKQYYNYTVISAEHLINKVNVDVINYYFENEITLTKINRDFKKVFVHFLIKALCDKCLHLNVLNEKILFCNKSIISIKSEIFDTIDYKMYNTFVEGILKEVQTLIPISVYFSDDITFQDISESSKMNDLKFNFDYIYNQNNSHRSLHKLSQYAEHLGLNFLKRDYLTQPKLHKVFI